MAAKKESSGKVSKFEVASLSKQTRLASVQLEAREVRKLESDLLAFLLVASFEEGSAMFGFGWVRWIFKKIRKFWEEGSDRPPSLTHAKRTDELFQALYECGIPAWVARRNAEAFMVLRPDFDLHSPKHERIKRLLDFHRREFQNAYQAIAMQQGQDVADQWLAYVRSEGIFWARIVALPDDFSVRYLFGC